MHTYVPAHLPYLPCPTLPYPVYSVYVHISSLLRRAAFHTFLSGKLHTSIFAVLPCQAVAAAVKQGRWSKKFGCELVSSSNT